MIYYYIMCGMSGCKTNNSILATIPTPTTSQAEVRFFYVDPPGFCPLAALSGHTTVSL